MTQTAKSYLDRVKEQMSQGFQPKYSGITKRCLVSLGHIVRQGSKVLEAHDGGSDQVVWQPCQRLLRRVNQSLNMHLIPSQRNSQHG